MRLRFAVCCALASALLASAGSAHAQLGEVELDRGPSAELYIRKRPAVPESPKIPKELETLLLKREKQAAAKRTEAIGLLRSFLRSKPTGQNRAEGLFKLAELLWEEARVKHIQRMDKYERALERCRNTPGRCRRQPKEPRLDFSESEKYYRKILTDHKSFRRTDLVLYLVGFSAKEAGRNSEAMRFFNAVIKGYPDSPLYADSWMMVGEFYFAASRWTQARNAYQNILEDKDAPTYDLALFKTAWCDWKLGETKKAALRFKEVLDLAVQAQRSGSRALRRRRAQLRDEALDYLVIVFTEDQSITAKEVYDFLASIGGETYSHAVLIRVADAYYDQAEYERSINTRKFLIKLKPTALAAAAHQQRIVESQLAALLPDDAIKEMKVLVELYGPGSTWAKANHRHNKKKVAHAIALTEALVRRTGTNFHADAQQDEKHRKRPSLALYSRAAQTYAFYLTQFEKNEHAAEIRFLYAEILFWKQKNYEKAGDNYFTVGKSAPVGKYHKEALLKAMDSFEKARPKNVTGKRSLTPVDRKFAAAVDLYATLFPADKALVGVIFRNGQLFFDYGDYDEAIKRFGLIVTKYPDDPNAGPAGDRILKALSKAEDYENIEDWARKLKKAKAFKSAGQQRRLNRLIIESIIKSGDKYASGGRYDRAARFYLRVSKEYPKDPRAPQSLFNAAAMYEKAKMPQRAATTYLRLPGKYPKSRLGEKAAYTAARVYEAMAYYDRAAEAYELVTKRYGRTKRGANALFNAGVLRQALGQNRKAIAHYQLYARRHRQRKDASEVAFQIGVVYEQAGNDGRADRAFKSYASRYRSGAHRIEAHTRAGRALLRLGRTRRAAREFSTALRLYKNLKGKQATPHTLWAAQARYYQGELIHKQYQRIKLAVKPRQLKKTLRRKLKLLDKAQAVYLDVVQMGDLQWATAALYRIGHIYELFATAMQDAPTPKGLSEADQDAYRAALDDMVVEIEEKAKKLYVGGYNKSLELKVYNKYTRKIRTALGRLASSKYPPENEIRYPVQIGDRVPMPELVKEVVRE